MFIRRIVTQPGARRNSCAQCLRIRMFLLTATSLILALFFVNQQGTPLSGLTPMKIAVAMMLLGSAAFALRVIDHVLYARHKS